MAWNLSRACQSVPRSLVPILWQTLPRFYCKYETDVLDDFTSQLMQKKIGKWDMQKRRNEFLIDAAPKVEEKQLEGVTIEGLGVEQLGCLFQDAIDADCFRSIDRLIELCIRHNKSPPFSVLINVLSTCSKSGNKDTIYQTQKLCKLHWPALLKENSDFKHFIAEAIWVKGDIPKAIELFEGVYRENAYLRRRIRLILKFLIADLVSNRSEAALWTIIDFSERILREYQDFFPLACVWQACFLSEWFTDQCVALELLERNNGLCKSVINRIPYVVFVSLKCHRTEVVYRLLEILLKYNMKQQYSSVLATLLDYQFQCGDLHSCSEIIKWAIQNNVTLPRSQHIRLINLLLNEKMKTPLVQLREKVQEKPKYNFKF